MIARAVLLLLSLAACGQGEPRVPQTSTPSTAVPTTALPFGAVGAIGGDPFGLEVRAEGSPSGDWSLFVRGRPQHAAPWTKIEVTGDEDLVYERASRTYDFAQGQPFEDRFALRAATREGVLRVRVSSSHGMPASSEASVGIRRGADGRFVAEVVRPGEN